MANMITPPEPGLYPGVDFETYLSWDAISNSRINLARKSPAHFYANVAIESTPTLRFGSLTHCGKLEPIQLARRYAVMPDYENDAANLTAKGEKPASPKATGYYKDKVNAFREANAGKEIVTADVFDNMVSLVTSLSKNDKARYYLEGDGDVEVSIVWDDPETGLRCKARLDKFSRSRQLITDLKTYTPQNGYRSARDKFERQIAQFGYHRQLSHYQKGILVLLHIECEMVLSFVENERPHNSMSAPLDESWLEIGRREVAETMQVIKECRETNHWPGYESPNAWIVPSWYGNDEEMSLIICGETLEV